MRVQQELGASKSVIGITLTTVHRGVDSLLAPRSRSTPTPAVRLGVALDRGAYELRGWAGFSHLRGDTADIIVCSARPCTTSSAPMPVT